MEFNLKIGTYLKSSHTSSQIIIRNTIALMPLLTYFIILDSKTLLILFINVIIYLILEILNNRVINKKITILEIFKSTYILYYSILLTFIIPINIFLIKLILINILNYIVYKVLTHINKRVVISIPVITMIFLLLFKIDLSTSYLYINNIDMYLLLTYIITIIYLFIINYQINIAYYISIFIYLIITFLLTQDNSILINIIKPIYVILTLFIINDNYMINPTSYGRNLIGITLAFITILLLKLNINHYQIIALIITNFLNILFIDNFIIRYRFNKNINKISIIILIILITLISTI